jgi:transcriptional regulator with XRE-family HTH domain
VRAITGAQPRPADLRGGDLESAEYIIYDKAMIAGSTISSTLRTLRLSRGLTIEQLGRRAGTSAATVSRYENGWTRFELQTLKRLASALGTRLEMQWRPLRDRPALSRRGGGLRMLSRLFWERPLSREDLKQYPEWVAGRVLQYGTVDDVRALVRALGRRRFLEIVSGLRLPTHRLRVFWDSVLDLEGVVCTRKRSRPPAASSWPA